MSRSEKAAHLGAIMEQRKVYTSERLFSKRPLQSSLMQRLRNLTHNSKAKELVIRLLRLEQTNPAQLEEEIAQYIANKLETLPPELKGIEKS